MTYSLQTFQPQKAILLIAWLLSSLSVIGQVNFSSSGLVGESSNNPTSLQFGPDGRLYVSQQNGTIYAYTIQRNGPNDYEVTSTETINLVKNIQNHNDDGSNSGNSNRQVTGILVTGTGANPILYVSSSDPRIGAGGGGNDTGLDTNSGVVSKLTCTGGIDGNGQCTGWTKVDLIRGLPRSEENHATNGMQLDEQNNILYIAQGGHTNAGAPSNNFAFTTEYALSAAVLEADLDVIEALPTQTDVVGAAYKYNLPTAQNVSKADLLLANDNDHPDPWGGDDGLNQAMLDPNGPVQIFSPGWRNLYDLVITESGRMYGVDNGANGGWGGYPEYEESYDATNNYLNGEPGSTGQGPDPSTYPNNITLLDGLNGTVASNGNPDPQVNNKNGLHLFSKGYYAGHPTPIRGNPDGAGLYYNGTFYAPGNSNLPASWPPVTEANPIECDFQQSGVDDNAIANYGPSTNGIAEYTASNFNNALKGALLLAAFNGNIYQVFLNGDGTVATNCPSNPANNCGDSFASGFGSNPLDVIAQGDDDAFGGTVWAVTYGADNITIFEPSDYDGNDPGQCLGNDDDTIDEDNDGYTNADEIDNGTNPCSGASKPADFDDVVEFNGFKRSDLNDADDDQDGIPDVDDAFCFDATNGKGGLGDLPVRLDLFNSTGYGFGSLGFTGIMTNGSQDYFGLIDDSGDELVFGGTAGIYTDPTVTDGDAFEGGNSQKNAFQFPVNVSTATGPFTVLGQINGPFFNDQAPQNFASHGIFIGTGDQQNYLKVTVRNNSGSSAFQVLLENNGSTSSQLVNVAGILDASTIIIYISVDPATGEVQASYSADGGTRTNIGTTVTLTGDLLAAVQGTYTINGQPSALAAGPIATSTGAAPEFSASWDYFEVTQNPSDAQANIQVNTGGINGSTFGNSSFYIENISTGSNITKVTYDLSTAVIPEVVFDPNGTAGDATSKDFTLNGGSDGGTGYTTHSFADAYEGGFYTLEVNFNDFGPSETIEFGLDIDPVSIKGGSAPGPNESGSVSGLELSGAIVTVTFDTGEEWTVELMSGENDSQGDSKNIARNALPEAPTISIDNVTSQSVVVTPNHTVTVTGPVGGEVLLLQLEAGLFLDGLNGPNAPDGYDIDPWEVNSVIGVTKLTGTISNSFTADFNVTLTDSDEEAGYNIFAAVIVDEDGANSDLSNIIIVEYDPDAAPAEEIRVNAGGPAYTDGQGKNWAADNFFVNGAAFTNAIAVANTDDDVLYQSERYNANLQYEIPVAGTGPYQVNLHFAELYFGLPGGGSAGGAGSRVFDIVIEGENKLLNFDIFAEVGAAAATIKTFGNINVSDGSLSISFPASANNGKVSAIEVLGFGSVGDIPINLSQIGNQISVEGVPAPFDIVATGGDGNLLYSASGLPTGLSVEPTNGDIIGTIAVGASAGGPNNDGIYNVTVSVDDSDGETNDLVSTSFTWTVLAPSQTQALFRVNAGGAQLAAADASSPDWSADTGSFGAAGNSPYLIAATTTGGTFTGNSGSAHPGPIITTDPSLAAFPEIPTEVFNTERWDGPGAPEMLWQFPVPQGTEVEIAILFAELFQDITGAGQRVFDISIDGVIPPVFDDIDPYAVAGPKGAFVRTFTTTSDGTIDIELIHGVENPAIKGIQISTVAASDNDPPVVVNPGTQSGVEGNPVSLQISATDTDPCDGLTYAATGLPPSLSIDENTGLITGTLDAGSGSGVAGAFIEDEGVLIIEAETDFVNTAGGWEPFTESGVDFLQATNNNFGNATGGEILTYDIQITTPGVYRFHMKSDITGTVTTDENDSWFKIDNTSDVHFFCSQGGTVGSTQDFLDEIADPSNTSQTYYYPAGNAAGRPNFSGSNPGNQGYFKVYRGGGGGNKWNTNTIDNNGFPIYAYFPSAGNYTINMSERSAGHKVDRFALIHIDDVSTGQPTGTLDGPESEQAVGGTAGAAENSPYNVTVTVTDACDPPAFSNVNFTWIVSETPPSGTPSALIEITPDGALGASTFGANSIQLTNTSTGNLQITSLTIDLSTGILPDMVFDPVGAGGDATASCFTANSGAAATGLITPADPCVSPFSAPRNGGFDVMSINFTDFDPGEQLFSTVDVDPNSIQGVPGAGGAGAVSGYELIGATVTISFSDGSVLVSNIYEDGSLGGGQAVMAENAPATPSIAVIGQDDITCVESANQTIVVTGPAGANVSLLLMDSRLFIQSGNPPFNVPDETFYANEAMSGKTLYTAVIGAGGTVEIPITLLETAGPGGTTNGGLNHIVAVLSDGPYAVDQQVSQTSNIVILKLDPSCAGSGADLTLTVSNQGRDLGLGTPDYSGEYAVNLFSLTDAQTPVASFTPTADASGVMTITDITPGTYQVAVKRAGFLQRVQVITLAEGANSATIAELLAGDVDGDNQVLLEDFSLLGGVFNSTNINPGGLPNYGDFNGDGSIGLEDFSVMGGNFNTAGENPVEQP